MHQMDSLQGRLSRYLGWEARLCFVLMDGKHIQHVLKLPFIKHRQDGVNISQEGKQEGSQGSRLEGPEVKENQK